MTVPAPTLDAADVRVTYGNDAEAQRHHAAAYQRLADELGRDVHVHAPHDGIGIFASTARMLREMNTRSGEPEPFMLNLFTAPTQTDGRPVAFSGDDEARDEDGNRVLLQAVTPMLRGDDETQEQAVAALYDELFDYGEAAGSAFRGQFDLDWLTDLVTHTPRAYARPVQPIMGWLFDDMAFIPYDIGHFPESTPFIETMVDRLLEAYGDQSLADLDQEERDRIRAERRAERAEARRLALIERSVEAVRTWATQTAQRRVREGESEVEHARNNQSAARERLVLATRNLDAAMHNLAVARAAEREPDPAEITGVRKMLEKGTITELSVDRQVMTFVTRTLTVFDDRTGAWHLLGRMRVRVNMGSGAMNITNLDRQVTGFNHENAAPHVLGGGEPCVGSYSTQVADMIANQNWLDMIALTIGFLESANTRDSAGRYVHRWPFIEDPTEYGRPAYEGEVEPFDEQAEWG